MNQWAFLTYPAAAVLGAGVGWCVYQIIAGFKLLRRPEEFGGINLVVFAMGTGVLVGCIGVLVSLMALLVFLGAS